MTRAPITRRRALGVIALGAAEQLLAGLLVTAAFLGAHLALPDGCGQRTHRLPPLAVILQCPLTGRQGWPLAMQT